MTISGFTMVRNATKLYYPIKQAISSILPLVDEFVVALGDCDPDDRTYEEIKSIGSDKIRKAQLPAKIVTARGIILERPEYWR